jgi:hypothetical protein
MGDDRSDLSVRRGRPLGDYGALFPGGTLWHWILGLSYAGLVILEAIGNEQWRVAATPYLDIALFVGLIPSVWRATRAPTQHKRNAEMRASMAALKGAALDPAVLDGYGLLDETGKLVDDTPPAWLDELTPEPRTLHRHVIVRAILTPALAAMVWVVLLVGLAAVDWLRDDWLIAAPIAAALVGIVWFAWRKSQHGPGANGG